jgi:hypothetical protein
MSIVAFKKKSVIQYGSKRSAKPPGGYWLPQGPFGKNTYSLETAKEHYGPVGFSLNGPHRNVGYVGKDSKFSKNGTPYRGVHAIGNGGTFGRYPVSEPVFNSNRVIVEGTQYMYVKPTVLTTKGMLEKRFRWAYNGKYPNYWVQPVYTGNQTDTKSQGLYIQDKSAANDCVIDVNNEAKYVGYIRCDRASCKNSEVKMKYNDIARNSLYTKTLHQPITSSQQTLRIQRRCVNPLGPQKPFPFAVQTGTGILTGGIRVNNVGSSCGTGPTFLTPPAWYSSLRQSVSA